MVDEKIFVAVAGNIGTGKTTLTQMLSSRLGWQAHFEAVADNPYLADFYQNMKRWSFPLQIYFLTNRFQAHQQINKSLVCGIQDRSIYEDANIFARNLYEQGQMEQRDYQNYLDLYNVMCQNLRPPDLMIYLKKSLPKLKHRIKMRGRDYEKDIPEEYLANLNHYYDDWMDHYDLGRKLIISSDDLDFLHNHADFNSLIHLIEKTLEHPEHKEKTDVEPFAMTRSFAKNTPPMIYQNAD